MSLKLKKLIFYCEDDADGKKYTRVLDGHDVQRWNNWMIGVCQFADLHNANPPWEKLTWVQTELEDDSEKSNTSKRILREIIDNENNS